MKIVESNAQRIAQPKIEEITENRKCKTIFHQQSLNKIKQKKKKENVKTQSSLLILSKAFSISTS